MATTCSRIQRSLAWCTGKPVLPGIKRRIYYTQKSNIVRFPSLQRDSNGCVTSAVLQGSFALAADKKWKYIDILPDKSQLTSESQGEEPSITQLNKLVAVHPGVDEDASAAAAYINNADCVFIVETMLGKYRVIGNDKWQTKAKVSQDLGQGATGTASTTIEVEASDECPAPFYTGTIETEEGDIDTSSSISNSSNNSQGNNSGNNQGNNQNNDESDDYILTYHFEDGSEEDQWYKAGQTVVPLTPTSGYKWPDSLPSVMPARNVSVTEVRITQQATNYKVTYTFNNGTTTEQSYSAGATITPPSPTSGYKWPDTLPSVMPSQNVRVTEQLIVVDNTEYTATFVKSNGTYSTITRVAGSAILAPVKGSNKEWWPTVPATMPVKNSIYVEVDEGLTVHYTVTYRFLNGTTQAIQYPKGFVLRDIMVGTELCPSNSRSGVHWSNRDKALEQDIIATEEYNDDDDVGV